jgi:hypothetical protein
MNLVQLSFSPGFSRVRSAEGKENPFKGFPVGDRCETVKTVPNFVRARYPAKAGCE